MSMGIQRGLKTHHQLQLMTLQSRRIRKTMNTIAGMLLILSSILKMI